MTRVPKAFAAILLVLLLAIPTTASSLLALAAQDPPAPVHPAFHPSAHTTRAGDPGLQTDISPEALAQIEALVLEKETRSATDRKLDSQLIYELKMRAGAQIAPGVQTIEADVPYATDGHAVLDVRANLTAALMEGLADLGAEMLSTSAAESTIRIHIGIDRVQELATMPDVLFVQPRQDAATSRHIRPAETTGFRSALVRSIEGVVASSAQQSNIIQGPTGLGSRSSEGDLTHLAVVARAAFGTTGAGIKIGVLSDGVRNLAASQASGDLGPVTVIGPPAPCASATCDEGTAMLEIIHDLAPDAELYFASAFVSITSFADNIRALRAAGCDIIVDDVFYYVETPFQDGQAPGLISNTNGGVVIQAVKDVTASGALYFSAAGNSGNFSDGTSGTWEGDFVDGGPTAGALAAGRLHNFGGQNFNLLRSANVEAPISLYWSDPLGGSANDYDLFRLNGAGTAVSASSTNIQNGTQDPFEQISQSMAAPRIVIVKNTAAQPRFLHLETNRGRLQFATPGVTHGHAAVDAVGAYGVAATAAVGPYPNPFGTESSIETFSSDGPRRIFFEADGTAITPGDLLATGGKVLQKPDLTAADGVSVTGAGGFPSPFFGTSAAAPHAAAIAALLKSARPGITSEQVRAALVESAIDIEEPGVDRDAGAGIIMANRALSSAGVAGTAALFLAGLHVSDNPGNGNGAVEAGEGARLTIPLTNHGIAAARAVSATLTSRTTGVTITQPSSSAYPDIDVSATAANTTAMAFTIASDFPCPRAASFELAMSFNGESTPRVFTFDVAIGPPSFQITTTLDRVPPPSSPGVTASSGVQHFRLFRDLTASTCGMSKAPPGLAANLFGPTHRQFDSYAFDTCETSAPTCVTVTLEGAKASGLFGAAYSPTLNPDNILENYKADAGGSASALSFSFDLPGGAQKFALDIHDVPQGLPAPSGSEYSLSVTGACLGACNPPNRVPVAKATDITVFADHTCGASASIDDGSEDADGDALTITQSPAGPYPLGTTPVRLTVVDPSGATSQANGSVTVVDTTAPAITCAAPITVSAPPGACSAPVPIATTASEACSPSVTIVSTHPTESIFPVGTTTVTFTATDAAANSASCPVVVTVLDNEAPSVSNLSVDVGRPRRPGDDADESDARRQDDTSETDGWNGKDGREGSDDRDDKDRSRRVVDVTVNYDLGDNCGASCVLTVAALEPVKPDRSDNMPPEWTIIDAKHVQFSVERSGHGLGRLYTLTLTCTDVAGNVTVKTATVRVPAGRFDSLGSLRAGPAR
jgi:hypothetical protein